MLYKKNKNSKLDFELFKNPTAEYRGAPFWAWNCELDKDVLCEQIEYLNEMGFGGFHMHSRSGMATDYLSEEFFGLVKSCVEKAKKENMLAYLYDEDRWPSGFAGGLVTKERKYRGRFIHFTKAKETDVYDEKTGIEKGLTYLFACYDIEIDEDGTLKYYKCIGENEEAEHNKWYAYVKTFEDSPRYNNQAYVDTLSKEAIDKFIEVTHEAYKKHVGDEFSKTIPSIFCDEPQFSTKETIENSRECTSVKYPWTPLLPEKYVQRYGRDIKTTLPEIFWDLPNGKPSRARYLYHDIICELFTSSFMDNCGKWCEENGIALTGHVMEEPTLKSQACVVGEAMRTYRSMGIPGIDMLCNLKELTTAKQVQSVVHQYGREAMMSELYGVTKWSFDFRGHKYQGDWQAALGVSLRVPHLAWVSMKGRGKRDYPASINYQSPWFREYPYVEDHFARLNTVLTRGKPMAEVAVIHPIESYWLRSGPTDTSADVLEDMNSNFLNITDWLVRGLIDFDFVSEALLAENGGADKGQLRMGEMRYKTVVVPNCETLRRTTFEALKAFAESGGKLIFVGKCPKYIDAEENEEIKKLYASSIVTEMSRAAVLKPLESSKFVSIKAGSGKNTDNLVCNLRKDKDVTWLFAAHLDMPKLKDAREKENLTIEINGEYVPRLYDTISGTVKEMNYTYNDGKTVIYAEVYEFDSLLTELTPGKKKCEYQKEKANEIIEKYDIKYLVDYSMEEKNVYLLDMAEYSLDGEDFGKTEEIRRIDKKCREILNFPSAANSDAQPWVFKKEKISHWVTLKYTIDSEIEYSGALLAAEEADYAELNGEEIRLDANGYFVDRSIKTYSLPKIRKGSNTLIVKVPFGVRTGTESMYLLGNFGVTVSGCEKCITALPKKIGFGNITEQKMPFYGGNITYKIDIEAKEAGRLKIMAGHYRGSLVKVKIDGKDAGRIVYSPYELISEEIVKGVHSVELTLFGNRENTFGALHNYGDREWYDGNQWYPEKYMCYEYLTEEAGILSAPEIELIKLQ